MKNLTAFLKTFCGPVLLILAGMAFGYFATLKAYPPSPHSEDKPAASVQLKCITISPDDRIYVGGSFGVAEVNPDLQLKSLFELPEVAQALAADTEGNFYIGYPAAIEKRDSKGDLLLRWGRGGCGGDAFSYVTGIAVDASNVFVADAGLRTVFRFSTDGIPLNEISGKTSGATGTGFFVPTPYFDCAVKDQSLYVTNPGCLRVERYTFKGDLLGYWEQSFDDPDHFPGCSNPTHLAIFPDLHVAASQKGKAHVRIYTSEGKPVLDLGRDIFPESTRGLDAAVDSKGLLYVVDPHALCVRKFDISAAAGKS